MLYLSFVLLINWLTNTCFWKYLSLSFSLSLFIIFVLYSHTTIQTPLFIHIIHVVLHINMECVNLGHVAMD